MAVVEGSFIATGASATITPEIGDRRGGGQFNVLLAGMVAGDLVDLERSFDGGVTFYPVLTVDGTTATGSNEIHSEPETGVMWRFNATALAAAGPIIYRLST